jgi:hypothetical protein
VAFCSGFDFHNPTFSNSIWREEDGKRPRRGAPKRSPEMTKNTKDLFYVALKHRDDMFTGLRVSSDPNDFKSETKKKPEKKQKAKPEAKPQQNKGVFQGVIEDYTRSLESYRKFMPLTAGSPLPFHIRSQPLNWNLLLNLKGSVGPIWMARPTEFINWGSSLMQNF